MKRIIIAAAIILTSGVTALCITKTDGKPVGTQIKIENRGGSQTVSPAQKSDIQSAD